MAYLFIGSSFNINALENVVIFVMKMFESVVSMLWKRTIEHSVNIIAVKNRRIKFPVWSVHFTVLYLNRH